MSSGFGIGGGPGRCFPFWQELLACYVVNSSSEDASGSVKCLPALEDYRECLHHKKELARVRMMQEAYDKSFMTSPRGSASSSGEIKTLGLIPDRKPEDVNLRPSKYLPHIKPSIS